MNLQYQTGKKLSVVAVVLLFAFVTSAQTTAFSYQGRLTDAGVAGNGSFQMQFKLFDAANGGAQIGTTLTDVPVNVAQGNFTLKLDFGASVFTGADRWVEVAVRRNSGETYTTLDPREKIVSSPYSLRTLSASQADDSQKLGGVNANEYVTSTNTAGNSFIKNQTTPQAASNFNVSGNGTVGSLNSSGAVSIGGTTEPGTAPVGQGRLYFDSAANKFKISENGAAFVNLVGASGVSGSGTVNRLPYFSAATTLSDSVISQVSSNIGVGATNPLSKLHILASTTVPRVESSNTTGFASGWDFYHGATGKGYVGVADTAAPFGAGELMLFGGGNVKTSLWSNGTRALTVNTNGLIGIGMTSPTHALDVNGFFRASHVAGGNVVSETTGGVNGWAKLWMRTPVQSWSIGTSHTFNGNQLYFSNETTGQILMDIMPNGNVGIGTTNPSGGLEINRNWDGQFGALTLRGVQPTIRFSGTTSGNHSWLIHQPAAGHGNLEFYSSTTPGNWGSPKLSVGTNGTTQVRVLQITGGSDLAENFEISGEKIKAGMVVAIDPNNAGKLVVAHGAYNRQVAGVISGANNLSVGMLLPDLKEGKNSMPVALSGRVWVYADATKGAIKPGDLLTTSATPGHAMKVTQHRRASGAIIGKAMTELKSGTGMVLVLVSLQ